jgi:hypothetical protein
MTHTAGRQEDKERERTSADLTRERLPASPGCEAASSPEVIRRHARFVEARDKRSRRAAGKTTAKRSRDGLMARLWHGASLGASWVAPAVQEHFARCVAACLANDCFKSYLAQYQRGCHEVPSEPTR